MPPTIHSFRVYVPARDYAMSRRFYTALGFRPSDGWGGTTDFDLNGWGFRLQDYFVRPWAENFMVVIGVDDADKWHEHAKSVTAGGDYGDARALEPSTVDGARVAEVIDPSGVLLVFVGPAAAP